MCSDYELGGDIIELPVVELKEGRPGRQSVEQRTPRVNLDRKEAMLLALSRGERWIGIDLSRLQCAERAPIRAVRPPDQLVPSANAENRHGGGTDYVQNSV